MLRPSFVVGFVALALSLPFVQHVSWLGDEGVFLHAASRMLSGQKLYQDFFAFLPPGSYLLVAWFFGLFGQSFLVARGLAVLLIAGMAVLCFQLCLRLGSSKRQAVWLALLWALCAHGDWTVVSHHYMTGFFSLLGFFALLSGRRWQLALLGAGFAAGAAAMMTQTRGALCALAILILLVWARRRLREMALFCLAVLVPPLLCGVYLLLQGGLGAAFASVVVFTGKHYAGIQWVPFGAGVSLQTLPMVVAFPLAFVLSVGLLVRAKGAVFSEPGFRTALTLGMVGLISCFPRPDAVHVVLCAPLVLPLLGHCLFRGTSRQFLDRALVVALGLLGVLSFGHYSYQAIDGLRLPLVRAKRGSFRLAQGTDPKALTSLVQKINQLSPDATFFFYPYLPLLPFLTARTHVAKLDIYTPGWTQKDQYTATCSALSAASYVVLDHQFADPAFLKTLFPALLDPDPPEKRQFEAILLREFAPVLQTGRYELRTRPKGSLSCDGFQGQYPDPPR